MSNATETRPLTTEQVRRVDQALRETRALIAKEMRYSADLRKPAYLAQLNAHVTKLEGMKRATTTPG